MKTLFQMLALGLFLSGCATQYHHPIKKTADFNDDLAECRELTENNGIDDGLGASYRNSVDSCLESKGWRIVRQNCFDKNFGSRIPSSRACR